MPCADEASLRVAWDLRWPGQKGPKLNEALVQRRNDPQALELIDNSVQGWFIFGDLEYYLLLVNQISRLHHHGMAPSLDELELREAAV